MTSAAIRKAFLDFFESKGHKIVPSAPIVVKNDPTLMFINSGMAPFKDIFLGNQPIKYPRIADTQKCLRVSGKHNDLEEVGVDTYHHTMFEMLGNWSFGDYFKKEAIAWSWELLTEIYKIPKDRLYVTVFEGDPKENLEFDLESYNYWKEFVADSHILKGSKKDNFWEMGDTGPCGPCTEIHVDLRDDDVRKRVNGKDLVNTSNAEVIEIWNNVFMEFERKWNPNTGGAGELILWEKNYNGKNFNYDRIEKHRELTSIVPLKQKHVDTGMGFERLVMALQKKRSSYDTDIFQPVIEKVSEMSKIAYDGTIIPDPENYIKNSQTAPRQVKADVAMRVVADHIRAISFTIADGQLPSNTGAGYVIKRILRRAVRYGYSYLGFETPFLNELVPMLAEQFKDVFPELIAQKDFVVNVVREEESSFFKTLKAGIVLFESYIKHGPYGNKSGLLTKEEAEAPGADEAQMKRTALLLAEAQSDLALYGKRVLPGRFVFKLFDTHGFPVDLTRLMANEIGWSIDEKEFDKEMAAQKDRGRTAAATEQSDWVELEPGVKSDFIGYDYDESNAHVVKYRSIKQKDKELFQLVLDKTPFYAESGGQVGDTGYLDFGGEKIDVLDTKKENDLIVHFVKKLPAKVDASVHAEINTRRRNDTIKNHSATHLLQSALRQVLGHHVQQKGSLVNPDHLRFDFSHFSKMSNEEIAEVEQIVNDKIMENVPLDERRNVPIKEAEKLGATMLFGEKYGEFVRVITFDPKFSRELCGGTHVKATGQIGLFKIVSESSISAGVRRIEAVTGRKALEYVNARVNEVTAISELLKGTKNVAQGVNTLLEQNEKLNKENEHLQDKLVSGLVKQFRAEIAPLGKVQFLAKTDIDVTNADALRKLGIQLVQEVKDNYVFLLSTNGGGKTVVHLRIAPSLGINGNQLLKELSSTIKGGGPADFVQASAPAGKDVEELIKKLKEKFAS